MIFAFPTLFRSQFYCNFPVLASMGQFIESLATHVMGTAKRVDKRLTIFLGSIQRLFLSCI
jgi:hypothetical protein